VVPVGAGHSGGGHSRVPKEAGGAKARHSIWSVGHVIQTVPATIDGLIREVVVEYKNASEKVFRTTRRSARSVATLFKEEDLDLTQKLSAADGWSQYAISLEWLKGYCQQAGDPNAVCGIANIHVDKRLKNTNKNHKKQKGNKNKNLESKCVMYYCNACIVMYWPHTIYFPAMFPGVDRILNKERSAQTQAHVLCVQYLCTGQYN
jgi:hypothetical protein